VTNQSLSEELLKRLENLPPAEPRSKLEPLRVYILHWRRQGRSYRRIQRILREHCQMDVAYETLRRFVQRRERPRSAEPEPVAAAPPVSAAPLSDEAKPRWNFGADNPRTTTAAIEEKRPRLSPEERAAQVEFIRSLNK
jgi:hypothetical protein